MRTTVGNRRVDRPGANDVYIGRPSRWGNPYRLGRGAKRGSTIERYREYLARELMAGRVTVRDLAALTGKRLMCWCTPSACHGDVLAAAVDWAAAGARGPATWAGRLADAVEATVAA